MAFFVIDATRHLKPKIDSNILAVALRSDYLRCPTTEDDERRFAAVETKILRRISGLTG